MNIIPLEANSFCAEYLRKHLNKQFKSVDKMLDWSLDMPDEDFKRMMTAYRVSKKRKLDKEKGNEMVNISITKAAHERLKELAKGVTLSQYIETMNGTLVDLEEINDKLKADNIDLNYQNDKLLLQLRTIMGSAYNWVEEMDTLKADNEALKTVNAELRKELLASKKARIKQPEPEKTIASIEPIEKKKPLGQCCAKKSNGFRCRNTAYHYYKEGNLCNTHERFISSGIDFI